MEASAPPSPSKTKCLDCNFSTSWDFALRHHASEAHEKPSITFDCSSKIQTFKCDDCYYETNYKLALTQHKKDWEEVIDILSDDEDTPLSKLIQEKKYKCKKCDDFRTLSKLVLLKHLKECVKDPRSEKWYECDQCTYKGKYKRNLRLHKYNMHAPPELITWHRCQYCLFKTKHKGNLKQHVISLHTEIDEVEWFECEQCSYKTKINAHLKRHFYINHAALHQIQWFECAHCPYKAMR